MLCLLRSRAFEPVARTQLASGWHVLEAEAWRWTERRFSIAVAQGMRSVKLEVTAPETLAMPVTLTGGGRAHTLPRAGDYSIQFDIPAGAMLVEFELDSALPPDLRDNRERGIIVRGVEVS